MDVCVLFGFSTFADQENIKGERFVICKNLLWFKNNLKEIERLQRFCETHHLKIFREGNQLFIGFGIAHFTNSKSTNLHTFHSRMNNINQNMDILSSFLKDIIEDCKFENASTLQYLCVNYSLCAKKK